MVNFELEKSDQKYQHQNFTTCKSVWKLAFNKYEGSSGQKMDFLPKYMKIQIDVAAFQIQ